MRDETLLLVRERRQTHGDFTDHARVTCALQDTIDEECMQRVARGQSDLTPTQRESLHMILHKIGRIVAGDPTVTDHWDDIAGYAKIANGHPKQLQSAVEPL